jgi:hypothetical protein
LSSNCTNSFDFCNAIFEKSLTKRKISLNHRARALFIEALHRNAAHRSRTLIARIELKHDERRVEVSRMMFSNVAQRRRALQYSEIRVPSAKITLG